MKPGVYALLLSLVSGSEAFGREQIYVLRNEPSTTFLAPLREVNRRTPATTPDQLRTAYERLELTYAPFPEKKALLEEVKGPLLSGRRPSDNNAEVSFTMLVNKREVRTGEQRNARLEVFNDFVGNLGRLKDEINGLSLPNDWFTKIYEINERPPAASDEMVQKVFTRLADQSAKDPVQLAAAQELQTFFKDFEKDRIKKGTVNYRILNTMLLHSTAPTVLFSLQSRDDQRRGRVQAVKNFIVEYAKIKQEADPGYADRQALAASKEVFVNAIGGGCVVPHEAIVDQALARISAVTARIEREMNPAVGLRRAYTEGFRAAYTKAHGEAPRQERADSTLLRAWTTFTNEFTAPGDDSFKTQKMLFLQSLSWEISGVRNTVCKGQAPATPESDAAATPSTVVPVKAPERPD